MIVLHEDKIKFLISYNGPKVLVFNVDIYSIGQSNNIPRDFAISTYCNGILNSS